MIAWENWTGPSADFHRTLKREGYYGVGEFKQVTVEVPVSESSISGPFSGAEIVWTNGRIIRFPGVDALQLNLNGLGRGTIDQQEWFKCDRFSTAIGNASPEKEFTAMICRGRRHV